MMTARPKLVTIWAHYGAYHIARVNALDAAGFDTTAYSYASVVPSYEFFHEQPTKHRLINDRDLDSINPVVSWFRTLRFLLTDGPDVILAAGYERPETFASIGYSRLKRLDGGQRPWTFIGVDNQIDDKARKRTVEAVKRVYIKAADGFCVGGPTHIEYLKHLGVDESEIFAGYNCVDNDLISRLAATARGDQSGGPYFLTLSRLIPKKNIGIIVAAYAAYRAKLPSEFAPWDLVIAGDGPMRASIAGDIEHRGLAPFVRMPGRINSISEAVQYYANCRAFILASNQSEQWGLVVNEAMAASAPVLVSQQCGCSQSLVRPAGNGFVFDGESATELSDHMVWMHRNEVALPEMGRESESIVAQYSPQRFAQNLMTFYRKVRDRRQ